MKRRKFISTTMAGAAGLSVFPSLCSGCRETHDPLHDFGLITNVVKNMIREDHRATMAMLAEMGYKYLEFGGTWGEDPEVLKAFMHDIGLIPLAGGASMANFQGDGLQKSIEGILAMGKKYLVCYWPWMTGAENLTWDEVKFAVDESYRIGETCRENGLRFALHNHYQEFRKLDDRVIYDYILEQTDPDLVTMEIDLYWAYKGGADITTYFEKYPGRFELVHVKDSYDSSDLRSFACVGEGILDFPHLFSYRDVAGFKHLIVEHDDPENERECAQTSIEYLKTIDF
ncbi:MAG: sugar phosphate isomerase/epimerase [Bacteroidales bacterium]